MRSSLKKTLVSLGLLCIAGAAAATAGFSAIYLYLSPSLPSVDSIRDVRLQTPLRVYSADNKLIGEFGEKRRRPVKLAEVPDAFVDALLAAEDADFYSHNGVSLRGLARAVTELITTGERGSGGSTLTMQLTRNVFLSLERKFIRKLNEILLSLKLERELSKDEILELYVNYMFLGKRAYGIQAAAEVYYGKDLNDLSLAQLTMIAGLFKGPSTQNPIINPTRAIERRNWILGRMLSLELISQAEYQQAYEEGITASYHASQLDIQAPYVADLAREKVINSFGLNAYTDGYKVYTTVDSRLQLAAQEALRKGLLDYDQRHGYRGPELKLNAPTPEDDTPSPEVLANWLKTLQDIQSLAKLEPAVVVKVLDQSVIAVAKDGSHHEITWDDGLSTARAYINENSRGPKPKNASDILSVGDVIRIRQALDRWRLSQLPEIQGALVALSPNNGAIVSIVGGFDFYASNFNRATQAYRQPGSNFKPFLYTAALENGMTAATIVNDAPTVIDDATLEKTWRPENDDGEFEGPTRMRKALYRSRNLISIRILESLGIRNALNSLERFGFDREKLPEDLTLALGTHSVTPDTMAAAWASFANGGYKVNTHLIKRVLGVDGNVIYEAFPNTVCESCQTEQAPPEKAQVNATELSENAFDHNAFELPIEIKRKYALLEPEDYPPAPKVISDQVVFIMDSILKDVIKRGTGIRARVLDRRDIAGKTGTTNDAKDTWFSGYNPDIVATTWVGFDKNTPLGRSEYGSSAALPIWIDFMREALRGKPEKVKKQPTGVVTIKIDPETGQRARADDPDAIFEYFRMELAPKHTLSEEASDSNVPPAIFSEEIF